MKRSEQQQLERQLIEDFDRLPFELQRRVAAYARLLAQPQGTPARELLPLVGTLDPESAREIREAIEEGCERVEPFD